MNSNIMQCDDQRLKRLLAADDHDIGHDPWMEHVEHCSQCQSRLRELAADDDQWRKAAAVLACDDEAVSSFGRGQETSASWNEAMARQLLQPPSHPEMLGRLGRYEMERMIGSGGMGIVFKAFDTELNRVVAVKVLAPYLATRGSARKRFAREARAAAGVRDDHVVPIFNVESVHEPLFLVMQYVAGGSLQEKLDRDGPLEVAEVLRIGLQTAKGLAAAHSQGLIHRDVKPSNILLDEGIERALLTDFGLARAEDDACLTRSGFHPGTPHYMSPEQVRGEAIDGRSDLFSLGCVLHALCTGHSPFRADTSYAVMRRITDEAPRSIRELNSNIPQWLEAIVMKLLSKSRDDRFDSAEQVAELLVKCLSHLTTPFTNPLPRITLGPSCVKRCVDTMNDKQNSMKRTNAAAVIYLAVGFAVFIASFVVASSSSRNITIVSWYWDSLGSLYGTLIYFSGLMGLYVACRNLWNSNGSTEIVTAIPVAVLPAVFGLIGSVHGYISVHHSISELGASIDQTQMSFAHVTVLTSLLVGLCFSIVPLIVIAIAALVRPKLPRAVVQPIGHDGSPTTTAPGLASDG